MTDRPMGLPVLQGYFFDASCGACGTAVRCNKESILKWPVQFDGLEDVKEIGVQCPGCGWHWSLGYTSGGLERIADRMLKVNDDRARYAVLLAEYLKAHRELQASVLARKQASLRGEPDHAQARHASLG